MILKNQNGSAIGMAVITLGAALAVSMYVLRVSTTAQLSSADIIKVQHLVPYKEKISRIGGFLIASNLIICKSDSWSNGAAKETCAWSGQNVAGGNTYKASDLGLLNEQMDGDNYLKYDLDLQYMFGQQSFMTGKNSSIRFKLLPTSEIKTSLGQQSSQQQTMDQDKFLIQMIISLEYINSKGKAQLSEFKSIFKRPIAIPKIKLTSSSCVSKCDVSISENPNPSCRSPQYNDPQTMTVVNGYIKNLGPGSLYKLGYERTMNYGPGSGPQGQSAQTTPEEMVVNLEITL